MLLLRVIVTLVACWIVKCDLLDLYVQHMDETMRTKLYRNKRHPLDPVSRRIKRNLWDGPFKIGCFKKQRLDVDEDWLKQWLKAKKRLVPYKDDALDYPNEREKNPNPDQHEVLTTQDSEQPEETSIIFEDAAGEISRASIDVEIAKPTYIAKDEIKSKNSTIEKRKGTLENESLAVQDRTNVEESAVEILEEDIPLEDWKDPEEVENEENSQFEIISENERINPKPFDDPSLKRTPKPRGSRVPKKYFPSSGKPVKDAREGDETATTRSRRSVKEYKGVENRTFDGNFTRYEQLDEKGRVILEWDYSDYEEVVFRVTAKTLGYVGIGFNDKGNMKGADILLAWIDDHTGAVNLLDSHGIEEMNAAPVTDASQDVRVLGGLQNETHTVVTFVRNWQTCDPQDHALTDGNVKVLWAIHDTDPEFNTAVWHGDQRGAKILRLKSGAPHLPPLKTDDIHWDVKLNQFEVDNTDTVYWCKIFKASTLKEKHHMIGYTPLVEKANEDLVHHVILYECASTAPILGEYARIAGAHCYSPTMPRAWESCMQPVLAWARGSEGEWLPEHVGIPVAEHGKSSYYMLEVHYNNPTMKNVIDSSGVRLHLTQQFRPQEAGILVTGVAVSPLHLVPPRQKGYATAGYCTNQCTDMMFPKEGINIVSVVLHSHLAGRRLSLKHIRKGEELPKIVQDNHFDFDYQQSHTLTKEVKVLPGDELVAECVYGTIHRSRPTLGGYAAYQEMCLAFVMHYPRTPLAACYSMTPVKHFFMSLGVMSFKGMTMDYLEKLFLTNGTDLILPSVSQQLIDRTLVKEAESALRTMRDYTENSGDDNIFERLIIDQPQEFKGRTMADHMLAMPWQDEVLARAVEKNFYYGKHMTFCRKRDDQLALPADIKSFPNYTALLEFNETVCESNITSGFVGIPCTLVINLVTMVVALIIM